MLSMHSFDDRLSSLTALWDDGIEKDHLYKSRGGFFVEKKDTLSCVPVVR